MYSTWIHVEWLLSIVTVQIKAWIWSQGLKDKPKGNLREARTKSGSTLIGYQRVDKETLNGDVDDKTGPPRAAKWFLIPFSSAAAQ
jgi:hypothetical protein